MNINIRSDLNYTNKLNFTNARFFKCRNRVLNILKENESIQAE